MGLWQRFISFFRGGPSKEELARQEQDRREKEAALQQQALLAQQMKAMEEENKRKEAELQAEKERHQKALEAARAEEERKQKEREELLEKRFKEKEKELAGKFTGLLEDMEQKMGTVISEKEHANQREVEMGDEVEDLLAEKDRKLEETLEEKEKMEEEMELLAIEKEVMEQEAESLKEKERALAMKAEEVRIAKKKARIVDRPGLGMTDDEKEMLASVLGTYTFDNFVVGPNNRFPREAALTVAREPANAYNPLFIYSSVGLGKTHLLSAIGNHIIDNHKNLRVVYLTTERFTNELLKAVADNTIDDFRSQYREVDVLLIDDIQFLGKQERTQTEFFHTFNTLYNSHKQIVLASDRPPREIATLESRLQSRFEGGLITEMKAPELTTRRHILQKKAKEEELEVPEDVMDFLAARIKSNIRTLIGSQNRVAAYARLTGEACTVAMASEVLKDMLEGEGTA